MELNNTAKENPSACLLAVFPLAASVWELVDAISEVASTSYTHGWYAHIPIEGICYLVLVIGLTLGQYAIARAIARKSGWSFHATNSGLELAMLALALFT